MRERHPSARAICGGIVAGVAAAILYAAIVSAWLAGEGCAALVGAGPSLALRFGVMFAAIAAPVGVVVGAIEGLAFTAGARSAGRFARGEVTLARWRALIYAGLLMPLVVGFVTVGFARRGQLQSLAAASVLLAASYLAILATLTVAAWLQASHGRARALVVALAMGILGAASVVVDARIFVRRYGWIHVGIELGAFAALELAVLALAQGLRGVSSRIMSAWGALAILVVAAAAGVWGLSSWRQPDAAPLRAVATECGGAADHLLDVARAAGLRAEGGVATPVSSAESGLLAAPSNGARAAELPRRPGADVILITVDALRADHLGAYGYSRPTSPHLDALAADSAVFEHAYSAIPHTSYSTSTMLIGAPTHSLAQIGRLDALPTLVDVFSAAGYHTAGFFSPAIFYIDRPNFAALEQKKLGFERTDYNYFSETEDAVKRTDDVIAFFAETHPAHAFVWVHYFAPHEPYVDHPEMGPPFGSKAIDVYDGEIRWADREIGRLVDYLQAKRPGAIIVVTADHGEEFGEHGGSYHGSSLYEEQVHVPLIIHVPGAPARRIVAPVGAVDLAPTLAGLAGLTAPGAASGLDLSPWLGDAPPAESSLPPVFAELDTSKLVVSGTDRLICDVARGFCRLYALADDPRETKDLSTERPARAAELNALLGKWMAGIGGVSDPRERILALGDLGDRAALPSLGGVLADPAADAVAHLRAARSILRLLGDGTGDIDGTTRANVAHAAANDPDETTRAWARVATALLGDPAALSAIAARFPALPEGELGGRAALALAVNHRPEAAKALILALAGGPYAEPLAIQLIQALGETRDPTASPTLLHQYEDVRLRKFAALALGRIREQSNRDFLIKHMVDDQYASARAACAHALGDLAHGGDRVAAVALLDRFNHDSEPTVVGSAAWALARLGDASPVTPGVHLHITKTGLALRELWLVPADAGAPGALAVEINGAHVTVDTTIARDAYSIPMAADTKPVDIVVTVGKVSHLLVR